MSKKQILDYLSKVTAPPIVIIAQWPNPLRSMEVQSDGDIKFYNINNQSPLYHHRLVTDPDSFWREWKKSIIQLNEACIQPVINICLEEKKYIGHHLHALLSQNIMLHTDEKQPGKTWFFDSAARDRLHHSADCHSKWADRILTLMEKTL